MLPSCAATDAPSWIERDRLEILRGYAILDTEPEVAFNDITAIAAQVCRASVALVSFVDEQRQWFKSEIGFGHREIPIEQSICAYAIRQKGIFVVADMTEDPRFANNPLVGGEAHIRFYAGAVLQTSEGLPLGTLCIMDDKPRPDGLTPEQSRVLLALSRSVMRELELRRANRALAEKSALLNGTLESMDQGLIMVDAAGIVQVCNQRAIELLDLPSKLMETKPTFDAVRQHQYERGEFVNADQKLASVVQQRGLIVQDYCYERERPNGTVLEVRTAPLTSGGVVRTFTEITARKRTEAALAESEERYRALIEASTVMVWRAAPDGSILAGWGWETFCGQGPETYSGHGWLAAVHPDDRDGVISVWQDLLVNPRPGENEYRALHTSGEYRWVLARGVPLLNPDGSVREWTGTITDIHDKKVAEERVRRSEERHRALIEASALVVWIAEPDGWMREGLGWTELTGQPAAEYAGIGWLEVVHPDDRDQVQTAWESGIASCAPCQVEMRVRLIDGSYRWGLAKAVPVIAPDGSVREWIGTISDIHARKQAEESLTSSEERLRLALAATSLGIWDIDLRTAQWNWSHEMREVLGVSQDTPAGRDTFLDRVHPEDWSRIEHELYPALSKGAPARSAVFRIIRADNGDERWMETSGRTLHGDHGQPVRMLGTIQDITPRKQSDDALREGEERLRLALQAGRMFAWERDLRSDFVTRSENARDLIGLGSGPASEFAARIHPDDQARASSVLRGVWGSASEQNEIRYIRPDGQTIWLTARSVEISEGGKPTRLIGVTFDITDRKAAENELWRMANQDALTGLANRTLFQKRLSAALDDAEMKGGSVNLLLIDLDDFKDVNDTLGHDAGDALLKETARRLNEAVRECDTVARLGGDEFAIILVEPTCLDSAARLAETLAETLRTIFEYEGQTLSTKASIGVAAFPDHHRDPYELMKDADIALYKAKADGRSRAVVYTEAARGAMEQRVRVITEVREGLEEDQFVPFYQPKVCFRTGRIVGFEALARWQHPTRGVVTPGYFASAFDDPEIAVALGERIIRHVASDIRSWLDQGLDCGRVAVNFSSAEFADTYLARHVLGILADAGVPTKHFEVEVTETVFLERSTETASAVLKEFSEAGVSVALDDFGTGFASLTHLKKFPVDHIKIDQTFVRDLEGDRDDAAIVDAVITLGRTLGMQVTAEGVETSGQALRLTAMGCDYAQGYLYAKPMIGSRVPWLLDTWPEQIAGDVRQTA